MKIAHSVIVTPHRSGLYETTRELVVGLRAIGHDSRMYDPKPTDLHPKGTEDRGAPFCDAQWAADADVVLSHSGIDNTPLQDKPHYLVAHGRPRSSFLTERQGGTPIYSYHYHLNANDKLKGLITFWPEHIRYHRALLDKPIHYVPAPVDMTYWSPGESDYFTEGVNVVCTDAWRDDVDPFLPLHAFAIQGEGKLHLYATPKDKRGFSALIRRLQDRGQMGQVRGWVNNLRDVYRAADALWTANTIDTRTIREAAATGCPVYRIDEQLRATRYEPRLHTPQEAAHALAEVI